MTAAAGTLADALGTEASHRGASAIDRARAAARRLVPPASAGTRTASPAVVGLRAAVLLLGWLLVYAFVLSALQAHRGQAVLYDRFREQLGAATAPTSSAAAATGAPVALLDGRDLGLHDVVVVQGTTSSAMHLGPGHRRDTPLPGQPGISVLYGRSATFGAPFGQVTRARRGSTLRVTTGQGTFTYAVDRVRLPGDPVPPALAAGSSRLLLVTSSGAGALGALAPDHAVYVDLTLSGKGAPLGPTAPVAADEQAMAVETGGLATLVLWLQLLLVATTGVVVLGQRWGRWQTYLVGAPFALLALWGATSSAAQLLPNLV